MTRRAAASHLQAAADELCHVLRDPPDERLRKWLAGMIAAVVDKRDELIEPDAGKPGAVYRNSPKEK